MPKFKDLTGRKFGMLTVESMSRQVQSGNRMRYYWNCRCVCGNIHEARTDCLTSGLVKSCGCLKKKQDKINLRKNHRHKMSGTRLYSIWQKMKDRCLNKNTPCYPRYGGRGIKICEEWLVVDNFLEWAMENGYSDKLSIDRIDNDGNYEPSNCRWVTNKAQARNRRSNIMVNYQGENITLIEASEISGLSYRALYARHSRGDRGKKLFRPIENNERLVNYKGKAVTLKELSEVTGISYGTLVSRHFTGKRGSELIKSTNKTR